MGQATRVGLCHDLKHGMSMNHSALISQRAGDIIWSHAHACELWLDGGNPFWLLYHRERERVHDYSNTHVYKLAPDCLGSVWFKEMSKKFYRIFILWKFSYLHRRTEIFINTSIFFLYACIALCFGGKFSFAQTSWYNSFVFPVSQTLLEEISCIFKIQWDLTGHDILIQ
jgi:hypothetical protein